MVTGVFKMSRSHELAWAAGFFDGEGSISIAKSQNNRNRNGPCSEKWYHRLFLTVSQKAQEPLLELQRLFGGKIYVKTDRGKAVGFMWNLGQAAAAEALEQMMPYLRHKKQVAALGLDLQRTMVNNRRPVSEDVIQLRESIRQEIQRINSLN